MLAVTGCHAIRWSRTPVWFVAWPDLVHAIETLLLRRRDQAARHVENSGLGNDAAARLITGDAGFDGNIEEESFELAAVALGELHIGFSLPWRQMSGVHVCERSAGCQALPDEIANGGEDAGVHGLIQRVVGDEAADFVRRDRVHAQASEISGFP